MSGIWKSVSQYLNLRNDDEDDNDDKNKWIWINHVNQKAGSYYNQKVDNLSDSGFHYSRNQNKLIECENSTNISIKKKRNIKIMAIPTLLEHHIINDHKGPRKKDRKN